MTAEEAKLQRETIEFLRSNEQIDEWWNDRERNYMMDVPMMLVGEVEHLVKNFNQPTKWKQADVSGSFSQKDMENFAAKMLLTFDKSRTLKEELKLFCEYDH